ncbi:alanine dehydrogenase [Candidatus Woesearchaeota archaeon]|nr:alanine dehydrogenase [Candidatus Woesearchaeota archaeon]
MIIGVPKEVKNNENRVALTPSGVHELVRQGHKVVIEKNAGIGSGYSDEEYSMEGAQIVSQAQGWSAELVLKVKEPLEQEFPLMKEGQILFTYLHLAAGLRPLTEALLKKRITAIAYETVEDRQGALPLLAPMSIIAGRMAVHIAAHYLAKPQGGRGVLLAGMPGVHSGKVLIVGAGVVGSNAAKIAVGMNASVYIADINTQRLAYLEDVLPGKKTTIYSTTKTLASVVESADAVIGAALIPGAVAPKLITEEMVKSMKPGSVIVDVAIDQGGCCETSRPTSHADPVFVKHGVTHYCVTNMPGAYPRSSTKGLTNATLPYAIKLAAKGVEQFAKEDAGFAKGINTYQGKLTHKAVAEALKLEKEFVPLIQALSP